MTPARLTATLLALIALPADANEPTIPMFADETGSSGLEHVFSGGWEYMVGGGAAVFDCNDDLKPDVFLAGGAASARLFVNESDPAGPLRFAAVNSGLELAEVVGAYPVDIDSDAINDLVVLRVGPDRLMRGLGECRFSDASETWRFDGLDLWSTAFSATWGDKDWPTLAIGSYIDRQQEAFPWGSCTPNHLYRPDGDGFAPPEELLPAYCPLSMIFTDWSRSGRQDLRVSNDREYYKGGQEQLWQVLGREAPLSFTEAEGWARLRIWGMGIASGDVTMDGYPDFFLTSMADNKLQVLSGVPEEVQPAPRYVDEAFARGVTAHRPHTGGDLRPSTAWHAELEDLNNDGLLDLFITKGNVWSMPDFAEKDPNNLLLQRSDGTFFESAAASGVASAKQARGGAVVDLNLDGRLDIIAVNRNEPVEVWRNTGPDAGNWVQVHLSQSGGNSSAIGSVIEVKRADGAVLTREVTVGGGHAGGQLGGWHFGLGATDATDIRITWPDGQVSRWYTVGTNQFWLMKRESAPTPLVRAP